MGHLLIRNFDFNNIVLSDNTHVCKVMYKLPYVLLSGISVRLHDITIKEQNGFYKVSIRNKDSIRLISTIDGYFNQLDGYESFLKSDSIYFRKGPVINKVILTYMNKEYVDISILKIKRYASRCFAIVYIL